MLPNKTLTFRCAKRIRLYQLNFSMLLILALCCIPLLHSQTYQTQDLAPPPVRKVPLDDRNKLDEAKEFKIRTHLSIDLANAHLSAAERFTSESRFDEASAELGIYRAIYEDVLRYLDDLTKKTDRVRDAFRRVEISLRADSPRIETIRRSTPREYAMNIKALGEFTQDAREQALNSFYGQTVLKDINAVGQKGAESGQGKKQVVSGESKEP